ncbi:uncharacterized protein LOC129771045 [Toxorhynchites rutilus septentrionalis]|uniref:uncharacterized protein LOC129771045 n=1 Tax=Toxorhynchites rutilus septentrionalis TaxID=329112 RepID=UPI0024798BE6|nr:uncharacterized protein LOC129771045 [Toxorhynchites rutilus septentrionalis]
MKGLRSTILSLAVLVSVALANPHRRLVVRSAPSFFELPRRLVVRQAPIFDPQSALPKDVAGPVSQSEDSSVPIFDLEVVGPVDNVPKEDALAAVPVPVVAEPRSDVVAEEAVAAEAALPVDGVVVPEDIVPPMVEAEAAAEERAAVEQAVAVSEFQDVKNKLNIIMERIEMLHEMLSALQASKSNAQ